MTTVQDQTTPAAPSAYPELFKRYIMRSARAALTRLAQETVGLSEEGRERALHVLPFALELAPAWPTARDLLLHLAPKMEMAGYRDDWLPYLQQGLACSRQYQDPLASAELQFHIGHLYRLQSQFEPARHLLTASAAAFTALGQPAAQARSLNDLAYLAWHQHQYVEAQGFAKSALVCLPIVNPERATSFSVLGLVAIDLHKWLEAQNCFKEALEIRKEHGNQQGIAWNLQHLGYVFHRQGDLISAILHYETATHILAEIKDWRNCGIVQMSLGIVYWLMKQPTKALELYSSAESALRKAQDLLFVAKVLTNRGLSYLTLNEWQQSINCFTDSAALYEKLADRYGQLNALDGLGLAYTGAGAYQEAIAVFEAALGQLSLLQAEPGATLLAEELTTHLKEAEAHRERHHGAP